MLQSPGKNQLAKTMLSRRPAIASLQHLITPSLHSYANLAGEKGSDFLLEPPIKRSAANSPTAELVVMPCPPRPAAQKKFFTPGSQTMIKRPSGVNVRKPAQPRLMLTAARPGINLSIFSASNSLTLPSTGGSPGASSV